MELPWSARSTPPGSADPGDPPAPEALRRIHSYTTFSLVVTVAALLAAQLAQTRDVTAIVLAVAAAGLVAWQVSLWDPAPPRWLTVAAVSVATASSCAALISDSLPVAPLILAIAAGFFARGRRAEWLAYVALVGVLVLVPYLVAAIVPSVPLTAATRYAIVGGIAGLMAWALLRFTDYLWSLTVSLDAARRQAAALATMEERYRFSRDLHDIQGHTLTAIRVKTVLARRLIARDPAAAEAQLAEVEQLAVDAIASGRSLAYGGRRVSLASEVANAETLVTSAGIRWNLEGAVHAESLAGADPARAAERDELLGLVMREATTNLLRHAQATIVEVTIRPTTIAVRNDGAPDAGRAVRGLGHLADRIAAHGGTLTTRSDGGWFITEATL